jgi:PAS domain S-box-containing protein
VHHVAIFDLISLLAFLTAFIILVKGWRRSFLRDAKFLLGGLVLFSLFYSTCLFLQWSGLTDALDPVEDVIGALLPMMWAFFFYAFLQGALTYDLRQSEQSLLESERKLYTLMGNLPGIAYRCLNDRDWSMEFISEGCRELTGYEPADLLQHGTVSYGDLIHKDDRDAVWEQVQENLAKKRPFQLVYRIVTASGEEKWVWEQGVGVFSKDGELLALEGFIADISQQKLDQEALQKAHDELEEKVEERTAEIKEAYRKLEKAYRKIKNDQEKIIQLERHAIASRITSTLAHETRNPVSAIGGFARILKRKYAADPDLSPHFDIILEETQKLERLIAGILKAGHEAAAYFQALNPNELLDDLYLLTQEKARLSEVKLKKEKQPFSAHIIADKESIIVALKEIVLNAIEASPKDEEVVLKIIQEEGWIVFSVSDRGPGIDEQTLGRIYEPLFSTKKLSSGLGLSFAKELIEAQNGYIRLQTRPDKGTTFYVYFPIAK